MCAQTLEKLDRNAEYRFDPNAIIDVDDQLRARMQAVISSWASVDRYLTELACLFVGGEHRAVVTMIGAISNDGAREAALQAIASRALIDDPDGKALFDRALKWIREKRAARNRYAHWLMGFAPSHPDWILLVNPIHVLYSSAAARDQVLVTRQWHLAGGLPGEQPEHVMEPLKPDQVLVYRQQDIEHDFTLAMRALTIVVRLIRYASSPAYRPLMRTALSELLSTQSPAT